MTACTKGRKPFESDWPQQPEPTGMPGMSVRFEHPGQRSAMCMACLMLDNCHSTKHRFATKLVKGLHSFAFLIFWCVCPAHHCLFRAQSFFMDWESTIRLWTQDCLTTFRSLNFSCRMLSIPRRCDHSKPPECPSPTRTRFFFFHCLRLRRSSSRSQHATMPSFKAWTPFGDT